MIRVNSDLKHLTEELHAQRDDHRSSILQRFFKTGPGQYAEGDIFLGLSVPAQRQIAKKYSHLGFEELSGLLSSDIHEYRLVALLILVRQYRDAPNLRQKKKISDFYYSKRRRINNWDLVDLSSYNILGDYLLVTKQGISRLIKMSASSNIWERRIAMVSTFAFIKAGRAKEPLAIASRLLADKHDLIHKAVGWMLRETGKRASESALLSFLDHNAAKMPRTALRYAIERLGPKQRMYYLNIKKVL